MIINIDDLSINYEINGAGEDVLLIHGWGSDLRCFANLSNLLMTKYRIISIDLPGFGKSSMLKNSFSVDDYADIIIKFLNDLKVSNVILIGHSYGGRIILKLNSRSSLPFNIKKNVIIDGAGIKPKRSLKTRFKILTFKMLKVLIKILIINNDKKNEIETEIRKKFGSADYSSAPKVLQETLVKSVNEDLSPLLKNMRETLLIWGDKDTDTPLWMAKKMEKEINNSGLVVLNGGHFSFIDDQFTFSKVIMSYFNI